MQIEKETLLEFKSLFNEWNNQVDINSFKDGNISVYLKVYQ